MVGMRLVPGSPNWVYTLVLPHIDSLSIWHVLVGVAFGQAPGVFIQTKAG